MVNYSTSSQKLKSSDDVYGLKARQPDGSTAQKQVQRASAAFKKLLKFSKASNALKPKKDKSIYGHKDI